MLNKKDISFFIQYYRKSLCQSLLYTNMQLLTQYFVSSTFHTRVVFSFNIAVNFFRKLTIIGKSDHIFTLNGTKSEIFSIFCIRNGDTEV